MQVRHAFLAAALLASIGCATTEPTPQKPPKAEPAAQKPDWVQTLEQSHGVQIGVAPVTIPIGPIGVPELDQGALVVVGPAAISLNGDAIVPTVLSGTTIEAPAAQSRRVESHLLIRQLFDAAKARNPFYSFNAPTHSTATARPAVLVADQRAPLGLLDRVRWSMHDAGYRTSGWVVRGSDGSPVELKLDAPPRCPIMPPLSVPELTSAGMAGSPSAIVIAPATVVGTCDAGSQDRLFRSTAELLASCYGRTVSRVALLLGERDDAVISWVTSADGSVEGVFAEAGFVSYAPELGECLLGVVRSVRHQPPEHGRCIATARVTYESGELLDRVLVEPPAGVPVKLEAPLTHMQGRLSSATLAIRLSKVDATGCPGTAFVAAELERTGINRLPAWLDEVVGREAMAVEQATLVVDQKVTLADMLLGLDAVARASGTGKLAVEVR